MGLEGLSAAKAAMIAIVVFSMVIASLFFVTNDVIQSNDTINKSAPEQLNNTFEKTEELRNITEDISGFVLNQDTSDTNALSSMLAAGYSVIRLFPAMLGVITGFINDVAVIFGLAQLNFLVASVIIIVVIVILFMVVRSIFSAGGGS